MLLILWPFPGKLSQYKAFKRFDYEEDNISKLINAFFMLNIMTEAYIPLLKLRIDDVYKIIRQRSPSHFIQKACIGTVALLVKNGE